MISLLAPVISKFLLAGGVGLYLYSLYVRYQANLAEIAKAKAQNVVRSDLETDAQKAKIADEKVIDLNDAINEFERNNPGKG